MSPQPEVAAEQPQLDPVDGMAQLAFVIMGLVERRAAEHQLSIPAVRLLGVLRDREPTMQELARFLGLDKSSVTGLVDRAERRGLVARTPSPADKRAVLVRLTDDGRSLVSEAAGLVAADVTAMLDRLAPRDRATLSRLVTRLLAAHAADQGIDLFATLPPLPAVQVRRELTGKPRAKRKHGTSQANTRKLTARLEPASGVPDVLSRSAAPYFVIIREVASRYPRSAAALLTRDRTLLTR